MRIAFVLIAFSCGRLLSACESSVVVTSSADAGPGTLRQAVAQACVSGMITFSLPPTTVIHLSSGPIVLVNSVTITSPAQTQLSISGGGKQQIFIVTGNPVLY